MYKKLSLLLNVNITVSTIKQTFNQGGRKVSVKWCNHLDKKNNAISDGLNKCGTNKMNYYYKKKRVDHL
jgi:hypothetical protein